MSTTVLMMFCREHKAITYLTIDTPVKIKITIHTFDVMPIVVSGDHTMSHHFRCFTRTGRNRVGPHVTRRKV